MLKDALGLNEDRVLPPTSAEVVTLLDEAYPENSGDPSWTHEKFLFCAGQRSVVRFLIELRERREHDLLQDTL